MNVVVRGGQTTLHYIRMLKQITLNILKIAIFVVVMFVIYNLHESSITFLDLKIYLKFFYSKVVSTFNDKTIYITSDIEVISLVNYINDVIYKSFFKGIRYGAISIIVVTILFAIRGSLMARKKILRGKQILSSKRLKINILFYNFFKNFLNLEKHFRLILISIIMLWNALLLVLKSLYNFPITLARIFVFLIKKLYNIVSTVFPNLVVKISPKIPQNTRLRKIMKRISTLDEININSHLNSIHKNYIELLSLYSSIKLARVPYPNKMSHTHTLVTGAPGTGKTVLMNGLIRQIRTKRQSAIIYDKMGVFIKYFYDPKTDIILNPLDQRSYNWDITKECKTKSHCDNIAAAFIPSRSSTSDPFWENSARILLSEVLHQSNNLEELIETLFKDEKKLEDIIQSSVALKRILPKDSKKTSGSIISVLYSYVYSLQLLENDSKERFSIRDWISDDTKNGFLIISSKADSQETLKPLLTAVFETAINSILSLPDNPDRNLWVLLDELPSLQYIPSLQPALAQSRQFGASFVLVLQVMSQLKDIYGIQKAESVSGSCSNRVIFSTPDKDTANWCSNSLGDVELEEVKESFTYGSHDMRDGVSANKHTSINNLVLPTEIMNLKNLSCFIRFGSGFGVAKIKLRITQYRSQAEPFLESQNIMDQLPLSKNYEEENKVEDIIPDLDGDNEIISEDFSEDEGSQDLFEEEQEDNSESSSDEDEETSDDFDDPIESEDEENIYNKF